MEDVIRVLDPNLYSNIEQLAQSLTAEAEREALKPGEPIKISNLQAPESLRQGLQYLHTIENIHKAVEEQYARIVNYAGQANAPVVPRILGTLDPANKWSDYVDLMRVTSGVIPAQVWDPDQNTFVQVSKFKGYNGYTHLIQAIDRWQRAWEDKRAPIFDLRGTGVAPAGAVIGDGLLDPDWWTNLLDYRNLRASIIKSTINTVSLFDPRVDWNRIVHAVFSGRVHELSDREQQAIQGLEDWAILGMNIAILGRGQIIRNLGGLGEAIVRSSEAGFAGLLASGVAQHYIRESLAPTNKWMFNVMEASRRAYADNPNFLNYLRLTTVKHTLPLASTIGHVIKLFTIDIPHTILATPQAVVYRGIVGGLAEGTGGMVMAKWQVGLGKTIFRVARRYGENGGVLRIWSHSGDVEMSADNLRGITRAAERVVPREDPEAVNATIEYVSTSDIHEILSGVKDQVQKKGAVFGDEIPEKWRDVLLSLPDLDLTERGILRVVDTNGNSMFLDAATGHKMTDAIRYFREKYNPNKVLVSGLAEPVSGTEIASALGRYFMVASKVRAEKRAPGEFTKTRILPKIGDKQYMQEKFVDHFKRFILDPAKGRITRTTKKTVAFDINIEGIPLYVRINKETGDVSVFGRVGTSRILVDSMELPEFLSGIAAADGIRPVLYRGAVRVQRLLEAKEQIARMGVERGGITDIGAETIFATIANKNRHARLLSEAWEEALKEDSLRENPTEVARRIYRLARRKQRVGYVLRDFKGQEWVYYGSVGGKHVWVSQGGDVIRARSPLRGVVSILHGSLDGLSPDVARGFTRALLDAGVNRDLVGLIPFREYIDYLSENWGRLDMEGRRIVIHDIADDMGGDVSVRRAKNAYDIIKGNVILRFPDADNVGLVDVYVRFKGRRLHVWRVRIEEYQKAYEAAKFVEDALGSVEITRKGAKQTIENVKELIPEEFPVFDITMGGKTVALWYSGIIEGTHRRGVIAPTKDGFSVIDETGVRSFRDASEVVAEGPGFSVRTEMVNELEPKESVVEEEPVQSVQEEPPREEAAVEEVPPEEPAEEAKLPTWEELAPRNLEDMKVTPEITPEEAALQLDKFYVKDFLREHVQVFGVAPSSLKRAALRGDVLPRAIAEAVDAIDNILTAAKEALSDTDWQGFVKQSGSGEGGVAASMLYGLIRGEHFKGLLKDALQRGKNTGYKEIADALIRFKKHIETLGISTVLFPKKFWDTFGERVELVDRVARESGLELDPVDYIDAVFGEALMKRAADGGQIDVRMLMRLTAAGSLIASYLILDKWLTDLSTKTGNESLLLLDSIKLPLFAYIALGGYAAARGFLDRRFLQTHKKFTRLLASNDEFLRLAIELMPEYRDLLGGESKTFEDAARGEALLALEYDTALSIVRRIARMRVTSRVEDIRGVRLVSPREFAEKNKAFKLQDDHIEVAHIVFGREFDPYNPVHVGFVKAITKFLRDMTHSKNVKEYARQHPDEVKNALAWMSSSILHETRIGLAMASGLERVFPLAPAFHQAPTLYSLFAPAEYRFNVRMDTFDAGVRALFRRHYGRNPVAVDNDAIKNWLAKRILDEVNKEDGTLKVEAYGAEYGGNRICYRHEDAAFLRPEEFGELSPEWRAGLILDGLIPEKWAEANGFDTDVRFARALRQYIDGTLGNIVQDAVAKGLLQHEDLQDHYFHHTNYAQEVLLSIGKERIKDVASQFMVSIDREFVLAGGRPSARKPRPFRIRRGIPGYTHNFYLSVSSLARELLRFDEFYYPTRAAEHILAAVRRKTDARNYVQNLLDYVDYVVGVPSTKGFDPTAPDASGFAVLRGIEKGLQWAKNAMYFVFLWHNWRVGMKNLFQARLVSYLASKYLPPWEMTKSSAVIYARAMEDASRILGGKDPLYLDRAEVEEALAGRLYYAINPHGPGWSFGRTAFGASGYAIWNLADYTNRIFAWMMAKHIKDFLGLTDAEGHALARRFVTITQFDYGRAGIPIARFSGVGAFMKYMPFVRWPISYFAYLKHLLDTRNYTAIMLHGLYDTLIFSMVRLYSPVNLSNVFFGPFMFAGRLVDPTDWRYLYPPMQYLYDISNIVRYAFGDRSYAVRYAMARAPESFLAAAGIWRDVYNILVHHGIYDPFGRKIVSMNLWDAFFYPFFSSGRLVDNAMWNKAISRAVEQIGEVNRQIAKLYMDYHGIDEWGNKVKPKIGFKEFEEKYNEQVKRGQDVLDRLYRQSVSYARRLNRGIPEEWQIKISELDYHPPTWRDVWRQIMENKYKTSVERAPRPGVDLVGRAGQQVFLRATPSAYERLVRISEAIRIAPR